MDKEDDRCQVELTAAQCEGICQGSIGPGFLGVNMDRIRELFAKTLTIHEGEILKSRWGLDGVTQETFFELAERLGIPTRHVRRLEDNALCKLRAAVVNKKGG